MSPFGSKTFTNDVSQWPANGPDGDWRATDGAGAGIEGSTGGAVGDGPEPPPPRSGRAKTAKRAGVMATSCFDGGLGVRARMLRSLPFERNGAPGNGGGTITSATREPPA